MLIWLLTVGEPLPIPGTHPRLYRAGSLAKSLTSQGHQVVWWTSTFDHFSKKHHVKGDSAFDWEGGEVRMLHSFGYRRNVSLQRFMEHMHVAKKFLRQAKTSSKPDLIVASFPTIELAKAAVEFGLEFGIPVVVDIRDLWPDVLFDFFPAPVQKLVRRTLTWMDKDTDFLLEHAFSVIGISQGYLDWGIKKINRTPSKWDRVFPLGYTLATYPDEQLAAAQKKLTAMGVDTSKKIFWYVGTMNHQFELKTLCAVANKMYQDKKPVQFVISGTGVLENEWRELAAQLPNVVFTGWVDAIEIAFLRKHSHVGLQPYLRSARMGLANKLFEYLSAGLPILSSLQGENKTLLDEFHCGFTYDEGDVEDCYQKALKLLNDAEHQSMSRNAKALYDDKFDAAKLEKEFLQFLKDVGQQGSEAKKHLPEMRKVKGE